VQSQSQKIKTFEDTMVQLDEVFTTSASDSESGNMVVAQELKRLQEVQLNKVFELQSDIAILKSLKDMP
jgi:hypothetical protein